MKAAPRPVAYLPVVVAIIAGSWFAWQGWRTWERYVPVGAIVVAAKVDTMVIVGKPTYHPEITFEYIADGFTQTSSTAFKGNPPMSASNSKEYVDQYPVGTATSAFVNVNDTDDVVLIRDNRWLLPLLVGVLGCLALIFLLWQDRDVWMPKLQRMLAKSEPSGPAKWDDPRGRPPAMNMQPPEGMEGARWDPTPDADGLPTGWVMDDKG